jgi:hypothetical protein
VLGKLSFDLPLYGFRLKAADRRARLLATQALRSSNFIFDIRGGLDRAWPRRGQYAQRVCLAG